MKINLIAIDMDGTTINEDQTLSEKNRGVIEEAIKKGILVVPTTGRMRSEIPLEVMKIEGIKYLITSNGASVVDIEKNQIIYENLIPHETTVKVAQKLRDYGLFYEVYHNGEAFMEKTTVEQLLSLGVPDEFAELMVIYRTTVDDIFDFVVNSGIDFEKINVSFGDLEVRENVIKELNEMEGIKITSSYKSNLEINNFSANKADGLEKLCSHLKLKKENILAIGDSHNDYEMLQFAGVSVAMANASPEIKEISDHITLSNEDAGVAYAIIKFCF